MIDQTLIVSGGINADNSLRWQSIFFLNPAPIASIQSDNAIDLGSARDIGIGHPPFLRVLMKALSLIDPGASITIDVRGANRTDLTDWAILAESPKLNLNSLATRGFFSLPVQVSTNTYRYLYARYLFENAGQLNLSVFADFGLEPTLENKYYPSGWAIA